MPNKLTKISITGRNSAGSFFVYIRQDAGIILGKDCYYFLW